jgi:hypothetical protein
MDSSVSPKDKIWFLRVCHHISNAVYNLEFQLPLHFIRGAQMFQKFGSDHAILDARWVHEAGSITDQRTVGVTGQNLVGQPTWLPVYLHPCTIISTLIIYVIFIVNQQQS